jgi:hypothetical protein
VDEPTLTTTETPFSDSLELSDGNATIASKVYCYEIEVEEP